MPCITEQRTCFLLPLLPPLLPPLCWWCFSRPIGAVSDDTLYVFTRPCESLHCRLTTCEKFFTRVQNQHDTVIKQFRSDRGSEFTSKRFDKLLSSKGIVRQTSAPHIHQQNGRAESLNNTILEKSESMQTHASCPQSWWEFSFQTAIHVYNRTPLRHTDWTTPFENIFGRKPDVQYFKTFGCLAWVYKPKEVCKISLILDQKL